MKRFTFSVPQNILFGEGVLKELPGAAGKLGGKHGFIISGPTLNRLGVVGQCEEILTQAGIAVSTFCDTEGNPSVETVERAAEAFRASGADFIVALGGGSPMDVAKAVGVVAKYGGSITEYEGADKVPGDRPADRHSYNSRNRFRGYGFFCYYRSQTKLQAYSIFL